MSLFVRVRPRKSETPGKTIRTGGKDLRLRSVAAVRRLAVDGSRRSFVECVVDGALPSFIGAVKSWATFPAPSSRDFCRPRKLAFL